MRIKFGNKIIEFDQAIQLGGTDRFVDLSSSRFRYIIDCEESNYAAWLIYKLLNNGYFNASGVDYNNSQDPTWLDYCLNKTEEQKIFGKWINKL